jgi:2-polyprenyl-3-methyl-5-hydroxy-6-metoxy-1,4-benzoquinol methylase
MSATGWDNFWKDQKQSFHDVMRIGTTFFAIETEKRFGLKPTTKIFDYGCGPGFLADYFSSTNINLTGADINPSFIAQCRSNHPQSLFFEITTDAVENEKLLSEKLGGKRFDYIILLSIAQYFKDVKEVEKVIQLLVSYTAQGGKIIVADVIDENTSSIRDAISLLFQCTRKNRIIAFLKFMAYVMSSDYRALSSKVKLLQVSEQSIKNIATALALNYERVDGLTIHASRTNYVFTKK